MARIPKHVQMSFKPNHRTSTHTQAQSCFLYLDCLSEWHDVCILSLENLLNNEGTLPGPHGQQRRGHLHWVGAFTAAKRLQWQTALHQLWTKRNDSNRGAAQGVCGREGVGHTEEYQCNKHIHLVIYIGHKRIDRWWMSGEMYNVLVGWQLYGCIDGCIDAWMCW